MAKPNTHIVGDGLALSLRHPFTAAEAETAGLSRHAVRRLVDQALLRRVVQGVYVDSGVPDSLELRAAALAKVLPPEAVVCDRTAAWLHGADVLGPADWNRVPAVQVFRLRGGSRIRRVRCAGGTRTLDLVRDTAQLGGIAVTTPLRTALDLGRFLKRYEAIAALDALMRVGGFTIDDLTAELPRFRGQRGVVQLRSLVPHCDGRAESPAESKVRLQLIDAGLPTPEVQWEVVNEAGIVIYRLDLAYPELMLAIEYDGREFHTSDSDRAHDAARRARLRALGWRILVLTRDDVYGDGTDIAQKVDRLRCNLASAG